MYCGKEADLFIKSFLDEFTFDYPDMQLYLRGDSGFALALAGSMRKQRIDTIRLKLLKIAARVVKSPRYKYFKLCSSCPYPCVLAE